jgi:hypothetical protein
MNTWKYVKSNIDAMDIFHLEQLTGTSLPQTISKFIINHNNGRPYLNNVKMPSGEEHIFEKLLSFNKNDVENFFSTYENIKSDLNPELIPIALDPFGNYFCLNVKNNFHVEFWRHESRSTESTGKDLLTLIEGLH